MAVEEVMPVGADGALLVRAVVRGDDGVAFGFAAEHVHLGRRRGHGRFVPRLVQIVLRFCYLFVCFGGVCVCWYWWGRALQGI